MKYFNNVKMQDFNILLLSFSNGVMKPMGRVQLLIEHNNQTKEFGITVVKTDRNR